jgi:ADP-heptose:LPS heptosyltransferase
MKRIMVIRLGAFGDFVQSFGPFAAIRAAHPDAEITLLTTAPFAKLARSSPWFDKVEVDRRPGWWNLPGLLRLRRQLRGFDRVYDLQTSGRSSRYFRLAGRPQWSGIAPGCDLPHDNPDRDALHTRERQRDQLGRAGITVFPTPDLSWLPPARGGLPRRYALLVPGASLHRPGKRWPTEYYGLLARMLWDRGATPVLIGGREEVDLGALVHLICPQAVDLIGRTTLGEIYALARGACICVGNDTGPMHLAALSGCPCLVLFGKDSNPDITAPRGPDGEWSSVARSDDLATLTAESVFEKVKALMRPTRA